nr:hypothetical protein [Nocardia cyriacigeorgica]
MRFARSRGIRQSRDRRSHLGGGVTADLPVEVPDEAVFVDHVQHVVAAIGRAEGDHAAGEVSSAQQLGLEFGQTCHRLESRRVMRVDER